MTTDLLQSISLIALSAAVILNSLTLIKIHRLFKQLASPPKVHLPPSWGQRMWVDSSEQERDR